MRRLYIYIDCTTYAMLLLWSTPVERSGLCRPRPSRKSARGAADSFPSPLAAADAAAAAAAARVASAGASWTTLSPPLASATTSATAAATASATASVAAMPSLPLLRSMARALAAHIPVRPASTRRSASRYLLRPLPPPPRSRGPLCYPRRPEGCGRPRCCRPSRQRPRRHRCGSKPRHLLRVRFRRQPSATRTPWRQPRHKPHALLT